MSSSPPLPSVSPVGGAGGTRRACVSVAAVSQTVLAASAFDQDPSHGLGRGSKEVSPIVPVLIRVIAEQTQIGLMH